MRKLSQVLTMLAICLSSVFMISGTASAEMNCRIGFTGPGSTNLCESTETFTCTVTNSTTVDIVNENVQVALSGNADNTNNTNGGSAITGTATNENGVTYNVSVINGACEVTSVTTPPIAPPTTPGRGAITQPVSAAAAGMGAVTSLPYTSSDNDVASQYIQFVVGTMGIGVIAACLAAVIYNYFLAR